MIIVLENNGEIVGTATIVHDKVVSTNGLDVIGTENSFGDMSYILEANSDCKCEELENKDRYHDLLDDILKDDEWEEEEDGVKTLQDYSSDELLEELRRRLRR